LLAHSPDTPELAAYPIKHAVPCLGYVITESPPTPKIDAARAKALGVSGPLLGTLRREGSVTIEGQLVHLEDVCHAALPPRKVVLLGDTSDASSLHAAGQGCHTVVHEATLASGMEDQAVANGHSTTNMAVDTALALGASRLILTHISPRYAVASPEETTPAKSTDLVLLDEARNAATARSSALEVELARDFATFSF